ncbi:MAG TPA: hypothetical protein DCZ04_09575, partial [Syntrophorhabdus aromaticivorans]|nr:hypothetical protein [Syntrophorhabdus aromaticivorans]
EEYASTKITRKSIPSVADIEEVKTFQFLEKVRKVIDTGGLERYGRVMEPLLEEDYTSLDIAAALLKLAMDEEGKDYMKETDLMAEQDRIRNRKKKTGRRSFSPRRRR